MLVLVLEADFKRNPSVIGSETRSLTPVRRPPEPTVRGLGLDDVASGVREVLARMRAFSRTSTSTSTKPRLLANQVPPPVPAAPSVSPSDSDPSCSVSSAASRFGSDWRELEPPHDVRSRDSVVRIVAFSL